MRFQNILSAVNNEAWFVTPAGWQTVHDLVTRAIDGKIPLPRAEDDEDGPSILDLFVSRRPPMSIDTNGIATITAEGVLGPKLSLIEKTCGATDYGDLQAEFQAAVDQGAKGVFLVADSPGGACRGCCETAAVIAAVNEKIPVLTWTDGSLCSAMYYVAAGSTSIVATRSSTSGSIGVILPWIDRSKAFALFGLQWDPITPEKADLKGTGAGPSLTDAQRAYLQETVEELAAQFANHVSAHRLVEDEVFRAGSYGGDRALSLGLIDAVGSRADAYNRLLSIVG